ncbi:hypothetical protein QBC34DRAFT_471378 [Podospora aff. communis PSN243]|uniref:Uncharacterized protein n=1 Tax=Podospora aff. communis PSN243 TaxID=3040156 RepID=A0AAV9H3D5_9PEZI|nr:hypothetical protein QBC34DRAFT_471378 [Podospora aff. communis PSN243]
MSVCMNVKMLCSSLQGMVGLRRRKDVKRQLQISQPFNFKKETTILPGVTEDEITVLREKAAASCLGVADELHSRSPSPDYAHPRQPPPIPTRHSSRNSTAALLASANEDAPFLTSSQPVSPSSSKVTGAPMDLDLGSPVSPLTPRGSPRSARSTRLVA